MKIQSCFFMFFSAGSFIKSAGAEESTTSPVQHSSLLHQKLYETNAAFWQSFTSLSQVGLLFYQEKVSDTVFIQLPATPEAV